MSKWLRRGFGQNSNNVPDDQQHQEQHSHHHPHTQSEFPSPPRNDMLGSSSAAVYQESPAPMGYGSPAPIAMDVDNHPSSRSSKYSPHPATYHHPQSTTSTALKTYERSRDDRSRTSSTRRDGRSRSSGHQQPAYRGATNAPAPQPYSPMQQTPVSYSKNVGVLANSTPPDAVQPSFPPPAVTADSPPPSESAQRRPAYLLHRDLVIGKGSYGQVCIASRGEPEGHNSGRSGKRKKFACKCVMLRNDPKYIAKLQEEVNVLRELRGHDNVIRLFDVFCVDNELFIITELGRGGDLFHLLTTHPKHGVTEAYAGKFGCQAIILCLNSKFI